MTAKIIKVRKLEVLDSGMLVVFLTNKGTIIKQYEYDEQFYKEFEKGYVKYKHGKEE